jgi:hypothetical protein
MKPQMRTLLWIFLIGGLTLLAFWVVVGPWFPQNSVVIGAIAASFGLSASGGFWMLYMAVRYERHPLRFVALSLLPFAFIWYYVERVRPGKHRTRADGPD